MKRAFGIDVPQTLEDVCCANRMALLIYDMQVGITRQVKDADVIVRQVRQVLDAARTASIRTFFTRSRSPGSRWKSVSSRRHATPRISGLYR